MTTGNRYIASEGKMFTSHASIDLYLHSIWHQIIGNGRFYIGHLMLCVFLFYTNVVIAKSNTLFDGDLSFLVPDGYSEIAIPSNSNIGYYAKSNNKTVALFAYRNSNFSVSKVLDGLDSCLCDLSKFELVDTEKEFFLNLTNDYVTRKYVSDYGLKFASHTRYVTNGAYCFGFWYYTDDEYKDFKDLIESIHFSEENGLGQIKLVIKYTKGITWIVLILLFVASFFAGAGGGNESWEVCAGYSLCITAVVAFLFLIPLWGFWIAYLSLLALFFIVCFLCAISGMHLTFDAD